jgi:hypothetical protein
MTRLRVDTAFMQGTRLASIVLLTAVILLASGPKASAGQGAPQPRRAFKTQAASSSPAPAGVSAAASGDVNSVNSIVAALYDVISGPAGKARDWERFRSLFAPGARLAAVSHLANGRTTSQGFTVDEYASRAAPAFVRAGFYEREIARQEETYSHISEVFSSYESRHAPGEKPFERGINAIQLVNDGRRWWVISIAWEAETNDHPIPENYLRH